jgi:hypothetical protein
VIANWTHRVITTRTPRSLFLILLPPVLVLLASLVGCNNSGSSDNAAKKADAPASSPALTSTQTPSPPAATAATQPTSALKFDPSAPFPALSGDILKLLEADQPELAKHRDALLKAEQQAIAAAIKSFQSQLKRPINPENKVGAFMPIWLPQPWASTRTQRVVSPPYSFIPSAYAAESTYSEAVGSLGSFHGALVGAAMVGWFGEYVTNPQSQSDKPIKNSAGKEGDTKAEITVISQPGTPTAVEIETRIDAPPFALEAFSRVSISGSVCPDATGMVKLHLTLSSKGKAGKNGKVKYGRNLDVTVIAVVDDNGNSSSTDYQSKQPDEDPMGSASLGAGAIGVAEHKWQSGKCVTINATSPGTVKPKTASRIPVAVVHKIDGSTVPAKVTAALAGGESVTPPVIPKAPGEITHIAVDKDGASMTITLKATSRRGNATTDLTINTKGMVFKLDGGADEFHGTGIVCDFEKPFKVSGDGLTVTFTPSSKAGGTYKYSGKLNGFEAWGKGTYTVKYNGDAPVHITAKGPGTVKTPMGDMTADGTEEYNVSASQDGCPYDKLLLD